MSTPLLTVQDAFQDRLLTGSETILDHLGDGARLLKAYDYAYGARLVEVLEKDFEDLHTLLGDDAFADMAQAYILAHPSRHKNIRWFGQHLAGWLATQSPWCDTASLSDMAALEWTLGLAFDAADAVPLRTEALGTVPPAAWPGLVFAPHPALMLVSLNTSVMDFHLALAEGRDPDGPPLALDRAETWAAWRDPETLAVRYRDLSGEEAVIVGMMREGRTFADIAEEMALSGDADTAAGRVASYLSEWIEQGWIIGFGGDGVNQG